MVLPNEGGMGQAPAAPAAPPRPRPKYNLYKGFESRAAQIKAQRKKTERDQQRQDQLAMRQNDQRQRMISANPQPRALVDVVQNEREEQRKLQTTMRKKGQGIGSALPYVPDAKPIIREDPYQVNPYRDLYDDPEKANMSLTTLPVVSRASVLAAIDPNDKTPLEAFSAQTRELLAQARLGNSDSLNQIVQNKIAMDEIASVQRKRIVADRSMARQFAAEEQEEKRRSFVAVPKTEQPHPTQFHSEPVLNYDSYREFYQQTSGTPDMRFVDIERVGVSRDGNPRFNIIFEDSEGKRHEKLTSPEPTAVYEWLRDNNVPFTPVREASPLGRPATLPGTPVPTTDSGLPSQIKAFYASIDSEDRVTEVVDKGIDEKTGYKKYEIKLTGKYGKEYTREILDRPGAMDVLAQNAGMKEAPKGLPTNDAEAETYILVNSLKETGFYQHNSSLREKTIGGIEYRVYNYKDAKGRKAEVRTGPGGESTIIYDIPNSPAVREYMKELERETGSLESARGVLQGQIHFMVLFDGELEKMRENGLDTSETSKEGKENRDRAALIVGGKVQNGLRGDALKQFLPVEPKGGIGGVVQYAVKSYTDLGGFVQHIQDILDKTDAYKLINKLPGAEWTPEDRVTEQQFEKEFQKRMGWAPMEVQMITRFGLSPVGIVFATAAPIAAAADAALSGVGGQVGLGLEKLGFDPMAVPLPWGGNLSDVVGQNAVAGAIIAGTASAMRGGFSWKRMLAYAAGGAVVGGGAGKAGVGPFGTPGEDFRVGPRGVGQFAGILVGPSQVDGIKTALGNVYTNPASIKNIPKAIKNAPLFRAGGRQLDAQLYNTGRRSSRFVDLENGDVVEITTGEFAGRTGTITKLGKNKTHTLTLEDGTSVKINDQRLKYSESAAGDVLNATGRRVTVQEAIDELDAQIKTAGKKVPGVIRTDAQNLKLKTLKQQRKEAVAELQRRTVAFDESMTAASPDISGALQLNDPVTIFDAAPEGYSGAFMSIDNSGDFWISDKLAKKGSAVVGEKILNKMSEDYEASLPSEVKAVRSAGDTLTGADELFQKAATSLGLRVEDVATAARNGGWKVIGPDGVIFGEVSGTVQNFINAMRRMGVPLEAKDFVVVAEGTGQTNVIAATEKAINAAEEYVMSRVANLPDSHSIMFKVGSGENVENYATTAGQVRSRGYNFEVNDPTQLMGAGPLDHLDTATVKRVLKNLTDENNSTSNLEQGLADQEVVVLAELKRQQRTAQEVLEAGEAQSFGRSSEALLAEVETKRAAQEEAGLVTTKNTPVTLMSESTYHESLIRQYENAETTSSGMRVVDMDDNTPIKFMMRVAQQAYTAPMIAATTRAWDRINQLFGSGMRPQRFEGISLGYRDNGLSFNKTIMGDSSDAVFVNIHGASKAGEFSSKAISERIVDTIFHEATHRFEVHAPRGGDEAFKKALREAREKFKVERKEVIASLTDELEETIFKTGLDSTLLDDATEFIRQRAEFFEKHRKLVDRNSQIGTGGIEDVRSNVDRLATWGIEGSVRRASEAARAKSLSGAIGGRRLGPADRIRARRARAQEGIAGSTRGVELQRPIPNPGTPDGLGWLDSYRRDETVQRVSAADDELERYSKLQEAYLTQEVGLYFNNNDRGVVISEAGAKIDTKTSIGFRQYNRVTTKVVINREGDIAHNIYDHAEGAEVLRPDLANTFDEMGTALERGELAFGVANYFNLNELTIETNPLRLTDDSIKGIIRAADALGQAQVRFWDKWNTLPEEAVTVSVSRLREQGKTGLTTASNRNRLTVALRSKSSRWVRPEEFDPFQQELAPEPLRVGDEVRIKDGQFKDRVGVLVGTTKKGGYKIRIDEADGETRDITIRHENSLQRTQAAEPIWDSLEMPLPRRTRQERIVELEEIIPTLSGKEKRNAQKTLDDLQEEEKFITFVDNEWPDQLSVREELLQTLTDIERFEAGVGPRALRPGDRIKITSGPFKGKNAILSEQGRDGWYATLAGKKAPKDPILVRSREIGVEPGALKRTNIKGELSARRKKAAALMSKLEFLLLPTEELVDELPLHHQTYQTAIAAQMPEYEMLMRHYTELLEQAYYAKAANNPTRLEELQPQIKDVLDEMRQIRSTATDVATTLNKYEAGRNSTHTRLNPALPDDTFMNFVRSAVKLKDDADELTDVRLGVGGTLAHGLTKIPGLRKVINVAQPGIVHATNWMGRRLLARNQLTAYLNTHIDNYINAMRAANKRGMFEFDRYGREKITGRPLGDVFEFWWEGKTSGPMVERKSGMHREAFANNPSVSAQRLADMDAYFDIVNRGRLDALENARKLGQPLPDNWFEDLHAFRDVVSRDGRIDIKAVARNSKRKPNSYEHRFYETMLEGMMDNINYNTDFEQVMALGTKVINEHAINKAFLKLIGEERSVPLKLFAAQKHRLNLAVARKDFARARELRKYAHNSLRGNPARPIMRKGRMLQEVPEEIHELLDTIAGINKRGITGAAKRAALQSYVQQADVIYKRLSDEVRLNQKQTKWAKENVDRSQQLSDYFPQSVQDEFAFKPSEWVETSMTSHSDFPELSTKLFIKEDAEWLAKHIAKTDNPLVKIGMKVRDVTGVMRTFQTTYDLGFLMIQGLGLLGTDFSNFAQSLVTGHPVRAVTATPIIGPRSIFARASWNAFKALADEKAAARWWDEQRIMHPEDFALYNRHARVSGLAEDLFEVGKLEKWEGKFVGNIPGVKSVKLTKRFGRSMSNFLNAGAWETWRSLRPLAKDARQLEELGAFVRNITGRSAVLESGMSEGQLAVERALMYAPSFTRAGIAIMAKAVFDPLSFGGRQAIKSMAGLTGAIMLFASAAALMKQLVEHDGNINELEWDDLADEVKESLNPFNLGEFATVRVGDVRYGLGGNFRSNISLLSRMVRASVEDPKALQEGDLSQLLTARPWDKDLSPIDLDNKFWINTKHPTLRWLRGKSSPAVSLGWDILTGESYTGIQYDNPADYLKVAATRLLPLSIQQWIESDVGMRDSFGLLGASFMGAKAQDIWKEQLYHEQAERDLGDTWFELQGTEYLKEAQKDPEHYPELTAAYEDYKNDKRKKGNDWQGLYDYVDKRRVERDQELLKLAKTIDWSRPGGGETYAEQAKYIKAKYVDDYEQEAERRGLNTDFPDNTDENDVNQDKLLGDKLDTIQLEDFTDAEGNPDYDKWEEARQKIIKQMSAREQEAVKNKKYTSLHDSSLAEIERRKDKAAALWGPYLDAPKYIGLSKEKGEELDALMKSLDEQIAMIKFNNPKSKMSRRYVLNYWLKNATLTDEQRRMYGVGLILTYNNLDYLVRDTSKRDLVINNPDFAIFYPNVYGDLTEEDQEFWVRKYGSRPGPKINYEFLEGMKED